MANMEITDIKPNKDWEKFTSSYSESERNMVNDHAENMVKSGQFKTADIKIYHEPGTKLSYIYVRSVARNKGSSRDKQREEYKTKHVHNYFRRNA